MHLTCKYGKYDLVNQVNVNEQIKIVQKFNTINNHTAKHNIPIIKANGKTPAVPTALRNANKMNALYDSERACPIPVMAINIVEMMNMILRP